MYKAFNTFIDDVFAFIITMPTAHRIACFRDDIVFVIYLVRIFPFIILGMLRSYFVGLTVFLCYLEFSINVGCIQLTKRD